MIVITEYIWGGKKFGYTIKGHCEECSVTKALVEDMLTKEFKGKDGAGLQTLAFRYAYNIANGRFLWRNRVGVKEEANT